MNINHEALERLAREICDSRNGAGHYDAKGTKRQHWRVKAAEMMAIAESNRLHVLRSLALIRWPA